VSLPITVLLVDDHVLVRRGFRRLLEDDPELSVVGEAGDGDDAARLVRELAPRVVIMDYSLPGMSGVDATRRLLSASPHLAVLMLSMHAERVFAQQARDAGARGYIEKSAAGVDLAAIIKRVAAGDTLWADDVPDRAAMPDAAARLPPRQREVLRLLCQGLTNAAIGDRLGISAHTVGAHRASMMRALGIHRSTELVAFAIRQGLVEDAP
jgi:DNA-binding NarL/FixJ family response regulator